VLGDVTGVTGLKIIRAILAGQRDPLKLAQLRDRRCQHSVAEIAQALAVPEPSTLVLIGTAFFTGLGYIGLRRRKPAVAEYASK
ncbi:MAG TPA: PEP-CTERM sorting domain-containing protein, partial [Gemmataceae bacterium]|nr:PEP-CTERM sorting domain-containing protein [Gemmataceae bacterium]